MKTKAKQDSLVVGLPQAMQKEASVLIIILVTSQHRVYMVKKDFINMKISTLVKKNNWKAQTNLSPPMFSSPINKVCEVFEAVGCSHDSI